MNFTKTLKKLTTSKEPWSNYVYGTNSIMLGVANQKDVLSFIFLNEEHELAIGEVSKESKKIIIISGKLLDEKKNQAAIIKEITEQFKTFKLLKKNI